MALLGHNWALGNGHTVLTVLLGLTEHYMLHSL